MPDLGGSLPKPSLLPPGIREQYQELMGSAIGEVFMLMAPAGVIALIVCMFVPRSKMRLHRALEEAER